MKAKKNVIVHDCTFEIGYAAGVVERFYNLLGIEMILTSARDSKHSANSLHYTGNAIDVRTNGIPKEVVNRLFDAIKQKLEPQGFDCLNEGDHLHIEFQPKQGEKFLEIVL